MPEAARGVNPRAVRGAVGGAVGDARGSVPTQSLVFLDRETVGHAGHIVENDAGKLDPALRVRHVGLPFGGQKRRIAKEQGEKLVDHGGDALAFLHHRGLSLIHISEPTRPY